ncbi:hypothetical protein D3C78_1765740 [compost metagenome]
MLADATALVGRFEVARTGMVEQQERADVAAEVVVGEQRAYRETVADPVGAGCAVYAENLFHGASV